jgi:ABC-2 type transport system ATP-binding protein
MVLIKDYRKRYGDVNIVAIPELELSVGLYWLKGENGSGKTTLLKSMAGLIPFDGTISVAGNDLNKRRKDYKSIVNYAEAEPLYPEFLTGNDLIRFYMDVKKGNALQLAHLVDTMGIGEYIDRKIATYSSGMIKKLSLVLAFIGKPKLLLLDEPLITLDIKAVANLQNVMGAYISNGTSFIVTSHQEMAVPNCKLQTLLVANKTVAVL